MIVLVVLMMIAVTTKTFAACVSYGSIHYPRSTPDVNQNSLSLPFLSLTKNSPLYISQSKNVNVNQFLYLYSWIYLSQASALFRNCFLISLKILDSLTKNNNTKWTIFRFQFET